MLELTPPGAEIMICILITTQEAAMLLCTADVWWDEDDFACLSMC